MFSHSHPAFYKVSPLSASRALMLLLVVHISKTALSHLGVWDHTKLCASEGSAPQPVSIDPGLLELLLTHY
jgi:hypothetical protein